jgi:alkanesulfonate monooxygenase SsuD/methylene tetrahydromethanopterin reductase-like flavin-dependent oxidoreductase (luciferase family)
MLDEALEVLAGLWSGQPFAYDGAHYHLDETLFRPRPVQTPRIPVWVAGYWPSRAAPGRGPLARAARWDGVFPLLRDATADPAAALAEIAARVREERARAGRPESDPFDLVHLAPPARPAEATEHADRLARCAAAGVTWWLDRLTPDEFGGRWDAPWPEPAMHAHVRRGPSRLAAC